MSSPQMTLLVTVTGRDRPGVTSRLFSVLAAHELSVVDAIYLGAVGDPRVQNPQYAAGLLLRLRFNLDLWVNLRPSWLLAPGLTPLRDAASIDLVVVRDGKNLKGRFLGLVLATVGKGVLEKAFAGSVKAIEARNGVAKGGGASRAT